MISFVIPLLLLGQSALHPEAASGWEAKEPVYAEKMMVVSANRHASEEGLKILQEGGSAIDAAIAMQMVLGLVEPQSSGIGGGALMLYYRKSDGKVVVYDGREIAPKKIPKSADTKLGGTAVAVPGLLKMVELAHQDEGKLPWSRLFDRAIELSQKGFLISSRLNQLVEASSELDTFPEVQNYFFSQDTLQPKSVGKMLNNPELAHAYGVIASQGAAPFYEGEIARDIVKTIQNAAVNPGTMTLEDLAAYTLEKIEAVRFTYQNFDFATMPPPSKGGVALSQMFGLLETKDLSSYDLGSVEFIDLFCKASRLALACRSSNSATSQICVVDGEGNIVTMTTSINHGFGSKLMVRGFLLNNTMDDFSAECENPVGSRKKPLSSMTPTIVFDKQSKKPILALGSAGGSAIVDYVAQALFGVLEFKMNIQEAIDFPHYVAIDETITLEKGTSLEKDQEALEALGNKVVTVPLTSGTAGISITPEGLIGSVDPRREGVALGI